MYKPIQLSHVSGKEIEKENESFMEQFSLNPLEAFSENSSEDIDDFSTEIFTEAVFREGKETIKPIEEQFQVIKDLLEKELDRNQIRKDTKFNPEKFVKNPVWKELENRMVKIFGFRNINIMHWNERYLAQDKDFESMEMNCYTWPTWRYPIDGIVTDKGIYDSTKSINTQISYSLGTIQKLSAGEITAVFLHELGHNIDPALVDITYTKTNILSKYLTDRKGKISTQEEKIVSKYKGGKLKFLADLVVIGAFTIFMLIPIIINAIKGMLWNPEKAKNEIKAALADDNEKFSRQTNAEAFADNFARMYGYGPQLMSALSKMKKYHDNHRNSRIQKEKERQKIYAEIILWSLKGEHKTTVHRAHNLIKEYEADLKDPDIPANVKKAIKEDLDELNKLLDSYLNSSDKFANQVNQIIIEELRKRDKSLIDSDKKDDRKNQDSKKDDKAALKERAIKEGVEIEFFEWSFMESIEAFEEKKKYVHPLKQRMDEKYPLEKGDLARIKKKFGNSSSCSWAKDEKGYFCYTHRCRSKSHPTIEGFPQKDVDFVRSTS